MYGCFVGGSSGSSVESDDCEYVCLWGTFCGAVAAFKIVCE